MIVLLLKMIFRDIFLRMVKYIPWIQEMCNEVVHMEPRFLAFIHDLFKTQKMCDNSVEENPHTLKFVPLNLRMHEMFMIILRQKRCATKQSGKIHGS